MILKNLTKTFLQGQIYKKLILPYHKFFSTATTIVDDSFILHPEVKHTAEMNVRATRRKFLK